MHSIYKTDGLTGKTRSFSPKRSKMGVVLIEGGRGLEYFARASRAMLQQKPCIHHWSIYIDHNIHQMAFNARTLKIELFEVHNSHASP